jgi:hypothetical protein
MLPAPNLLADRLAVMLKSRSTVLGSEPGGKTNKTTRNLDR